MAAAPKTVGASRGGIWSRLHPRCRSLVVLNVLGGMAVLGSYVFAFTGTPELKDGLWGGVPAGIRPLYTVNMLLAAAGFFPFTYAFVFTLDPERPLPGSGLPYRFLHLCYALVLVGSALWLPLTAAMLSAPGPLTWWAVRGVLALVGLGSTGLLLVLAQLVRQRGGASAWLGLVGCLPFWLQTAVLDALVWPAFFPL